MSDPVTPAAAQATTETPAQPASPPATANQAAPPAPPATPEAPATPQQTQQAQDLAAQAKAQNTLLGAEPFELKVPEGSTIDRVQLGRFKDLAQELGLKQDGAQKLVDWYSVAQREAQVIYRNQQVAAWNEEVRKHPELGGDAYDRTVSVAKEGLRRVASDKVISALESSGLGSHPAFIEMFARIGRLFQEDNTSGTAQSRPSSPQLKNPWDSFYTTTPPR